MTYLVHIEHALPKLNTLFVRYSSALRKARFPRAAAVKLPRRAAEQAQPTDVRQIQQRRNSRGSTVVGEGV